MTTQARTSRNWKRGITIFNIKKIEHNDVQVEASLEAHCMTPKAKDMFSQVYVRRKNPLLYFEIFFSISSLLSLMPSLLLIN